MTQPSGWSSRTQISVDGRTYESVEEMPPAVRHRYEDAMRAFDRDGNGVPDVLEGKPADPRVISQVTTSEKILVNGREYNDWNEVPAALRSMMDSRSSRPPRVGIFLNGPALAFLLAIAVLVGAGIMWAILRQ